MRIESYDIAMQASNTKEYQHQSTIHSQSIRASQNETGFTNQIATPELSIQVPSQMVLHDESELSLEDRIRKTIIEILLEELGVSKRKVKLYPYGQKQQEHHVVANPYQQQTATVNQAGFLLETKETYYQKNAVEFSTQATIKTNQGEFTIDVDYAFTQEFQEVHQSRLEFGAVAFEDPLIINYKDSVNGFDNISRHEKFTFDINSDGDQESISLLKDGAGFLALDKNNNGTIDNGQELFGPQTGNGFNELRQYDSDNNQWIDENDPIFDDLRIWAKDESGKDKLITLGQAGIGAIYLSGLKTDFNYHASLHEQNAKLKESSIVLKDNGTAQLITSVDFTV